MLLFTPDLDIPSLTAAMKRLAWTPADLALAANLREDHVRELLAERVHNARSVRAIQTAVNDALIARKSF
jgi:hypothetical protein